MTCAPPRRRVRSGERGSALVEFTWIGLLLLLPLVYVIVTVFTVQRSAYGATEAARSAGRAFILSPDVATARQRAYDAARLSMSDQGVAISPSNVVIVCRPTPQSCLQPGSSIEVRIHVDVRLPLVPDVLGRRPASVAVDATHTQTYGIYREAAE